MDSLVIERDEHLTASNAQRELKRRALLQHDDDRLIESPDCRRRSLARGHRHRMDRVHTGSTLALFCGERGVPMATTIGKFSIWSTIAVLAIVIIALALTLAR